MQVIIKWVHPKLSLAFISMACPENCQFFLLWYPKSDTKKLWERLMPFLFVFMMVFSSRFSVSRNTELTLSLSLRVSPKNFNQKIFVTACRLRTTSTAVVSLVRKKPTRIRPIWRGGGGGNCLVCQIFTAEHETEASLSVCCGLGLLFVCCTLRC